MEELRYDGEGYQPLVITESWQLAQLNYMPDLDAEIIATMDQHHLTDETFTLIAGRAFLITCETLEGSFELTDLKPGSTYNVPTKMWHNIVMEKGSSVIITENQNSHLGNYSKEPMTDEMKKAVQTHAKELWGEKK